jgi:PAS domain S-box-containing protein
MFIGKSITRATRLLLVVLMTALVPGLLLGATDGPKRILLLDSYGRNVAPVSTIISSFRRELSSRSPQPIGLHEVSLEMARFNQPEHELPFLTFLSGRFSHHQPHVVVAIGGPAFTFMERHHDLFPGVPIVIAGAAEQVVRSRAVPEHTVVVPITVDLKGSIEDLLKALPGITRIEVVLGTSPIETFWVKELERVFAAVSNPVKHTYLSQLSFHELRTHLAHLPPNSAVFYGMLLVDGAGVPSDPGEALKILAENANSPIFAVNESYLGLGIVGGRLMQEHAAGATAAEVALRILNGEPAAAITSIPEPPAVPVYDWRALQRWGIEEKRLPPGSVIQFRQPSIWDLYRGYIVGGVGLLTVQGILIAGLLLQRRQRARAELSLKQSERRLRLITNALPVLIAYVDAGQRYRFNNAAYVEWFGISPGDAQGRTIREVVGERFYRGILPHVERVLAGEHVHYAQDTVLPNGNRVSVEAIYVPDVDDGSVVRGFYALVMNVTERNAAQLESRRLQDELLHASRITTTGELAGTLAHEINQPLSAIMSNAQAATRFLDSPAPDLGELKEILQDIVADDARAGQVINRLRALLKKAKTDYETLDLNEVIREVAGFVRSDSVVRDVRVALDLDPRLLPVRGDRIQLQQVVLNLVLNAFDAVGGLPREERGVAIRTRLEDSEVHAAVQDSGNGVPADEIENVFKPFFTTKPQGLGMGLSISRSIINRHQGRIWVENNPGRGATFQFSLPVAPDTGRA